MAAKFAAIIAGLNNNQIDRIGRFAETVGVAFQIQDDILNLTGSTGWGKTIGDDITEGKRSLMVIYTLKNADKTHKKRLLQILDMHTNEPQLIKEAIDIMKSYDALEYAKKRANVITSDAWNSVKELFIAGDAKQRIEAFVGFMVDRKI
jgi:geranylgeranyl pyrophosphate synthase